MFDSKYFFLLQVWLMKFPQLTLCDLELKVSAEQKSFSLSYGIIPKSTSENLRCKFSNDCVRLCHYFFLSVTFF